MRLTRAIDRFLEAKQLESDFSVRSIQSYAWTLGKLDDAHPDATVATFEGRDGTDLLRAFLARWATLASATRATRISHVRSFFDWLELQDLVDANPARKIQRPPKRKPRIERPTASELRLVLAAARCTPTEPERPAILAMLGCGFRRQAVLDSVWRDWNLTDGTVRLKLKGGDWAILPVDPDVLDDMRDCYRALEPEPGHRLFPAQRVALIGPSRNVRTVRDWYGESSPQALWNMLKRVCQRAGVRDLHPHLLRHGFATQLDREGADLRTIQFLMGHAQAETTETYLDQRRLEAARDILSNLSHKRNQPGQQGLGVSETVESGWRESNPRSELTGTPAEQEPNADAPEAPEKPSQGGHKL